jgi:hypothetical protein
MGQTMRIPSPLTQIAYKIKDSSHCNGKEARIVIKGQRFSPFISFYVTITGNQNACLAGQADN